MTSRMLVFVTIIFLSLLNDISQIMARAQVQTAVAISVLAVGWSHDGSRIAAAGIRESGIGGYLVVIDVYTGETQYRLETPNAGFASVAWSPNGRLVAVGSYDQTVKLIDTQSWQIAATLSGHRWVVDSLAWNSDGSRLASSSSGDQQVIMWNAATFEQISRLEIADPWSMAFGPDDTQIAVAGSSGLWLIPSDLNFSEVPSREQFRLARGYLGALAWSHNGSWIAVGNQTFVPTTGERPDPVAAIVDVNTGVELRRFEVAGGEAIYAIAWTPDDQRIATYSLDGSVAVWAVIEGELIARYDGNPGYISRGLGFSPYGGRLAFGRTLVLNEATSTASQTNHLEVMQALANNGIQIVVPDPSLDRLNGIAADCVSVSAARDPLVADSLAEVGAFVERLDTLPDDAIPPACRADLLAVAEALMAGAGQ